MCRVVGLSKVSNSRSLGGIGDRRVGRDDELRQLRLLGPLAVVIDEEPAVAGEVGMKGHAEHALFDASAVDPVSQVEKRISAEPSSFRIEMTPVRSTTNRRSSPGGLRGAKVGWIESLSNCDELERLHRRQRRRGRSDRRDVAARKSSPGALLWYWAEGNSPCSQSSSERTQPHKPPRRSRPSSALHRGSCRGSRRRWPGVRPASCLEPRRRGR